MKRRLGVLVLMTLEHTTFVRVLDSDTAANLVPNWKARGTANVLAMMVRPMK
jgi:hypothetical protein